MRVISLVPSWTETLISCGIEVVGRTRFCIHPENCVKDIPVVGGTKNIDLELIKSLQPDLVVLDKEENPKSFVDDLVCSWWSSHVRKPQDVPDQLKELNDLIPGDRLIEVIHRWSLVLKDQQSLICGIEDFPEVMSWVNPLGDSDKIKHIVYLIWKDPEMAVAPETFIGGVLQLLGFGEFLTNFAEPYPKIDLSTYDKESTLLLFSSEPYPFTKQKEWIKALGFPSAIIDGESFSWFGLRTLEFLENLAKK